MRSVKRVLETTNYDIFKTLDGNRAVNKVHSKRLEESLSERYLMSPIIVNENYEIIDGQHRFDAAKKNDLPINFIKCEGYGLKEVQTLNANMKNWSKIDYLNAYCDLGYPEYIKFKQFMDDFPSFGVTSCELLLSDRHKSKKTDKSIVSKTNKSGTINVKDFENGNLKIKDYSLSVSNAKKIMKVKQYYDGFKRRSFITALVSLFKLDRYNHNLFIDKLKLNRTLLYHSPNANQYREQIEEIYNYKNRNKVNLRF